ncbi:MAG: hypothetical protein IJV31_11760 [Clostridia bacterium]|nr:hypothetical protein [Clostridia bacterium]
MTKIQIKNIIEQIQNEQHPIEDEETLAGYIEDAEYNINSYAGEKINYEIDLNAKSLLKNYVFYARYKRLAEFKQLYAGEYADLQAKYYKPSSV